MDRAGTLKTAVADKQGYYGRSVFYSNVHTSPYSTYYTLETTMRDKRLAQPVPPTSQ